MNGQRHTPTIEIAIGRELRLYHAYVTTAPPRLDAPATLTVHAAPLWDVRHLFTPADPVLVGLNTLQGWLWNRLGASHPDLATAQG